jgi:hypothetical protein
LTSIACFGKINMHPLKKDLNDRSDQKGLFNRGITL